MSERSLRSHEIQKWRRTVDVRRAYGCRAEEAREIVKGKSAFAKAAQHFGPMFCWYIRKRYQWTLFGQPKTRRQIVRAATMHVFLKD